MPLEEHLKQRACFLSAIFIFFHRALGLNIIQLGFTNPDVIGCNEIMYSGYGAMQEGKQTKN